VSDASLYPNDGFNLATSNKHVCIIPQIESVKGIENADEIAGVEGVNAIMFGPGDYMADAGIPVELKPIPDPRLVEAMGKFAAAGAKHKIPLFGYVFLSFVVKSMTNSSSELRKYQIRFHN
jgi:4-hydroxy-2-oxoheptanedioate aldolase